MAKYLDSSGITTLVGTLTGKYDERYANISHKHSSSDIDALTGYSSISVSGTTLSDSDTLNAALKKLFNLANSKLSSIPIATRTILGGIKTGKHYTAAATFSPVSTDPSTAPSINSVSTTANRYYAVETDSNGLAFVNVPWTDANTTYSIATTSTAGLVKPFSVITKPTINNLSDTSGRYYHVEMSSDGNMFVNVPWTDTKNAGTVTSVAMTVPTGFAISGSPITGAGTLALTFSSGYSLPTTAKQTNWDTAYSWGNHASAGYLKSVPQASDSVLGGIKIGYGASGKNYAVQLDEDGAAFVSVPWTDTNTTYSNATQSAAGLMSSADKTKLDNIASNATANKGTVTSVAMTVPTGFAISGSPITGAGTLALTFSSGYSLPTTAKQTNWDTAYSWGNHASAGYTKNKGTVTSVTLTQGAGITVSSSGTAITESGTRTISLNTATNTAKGGFMPWMSHTAASTYNGGSTAPSADNSVINVNAISTTASRYYAVETDSNGRAFVNVPWTDTKNAGTVTSVTLTQGVGITVSSSGTAITSSGTRTISLKQATSTELGGIKIGYGASGKNYAVQLDSNGAAFVYVPWTDTNTTYAAAKFNTLGLLKPSKTYTGAATLTTTAASATTAPTIAAISATNGRYYAVEADVNGVPFVNVPWTDTNTTYTFTPSNPTLAWGAQSTIGTIGGQTFTVTMPAKPTAADVGALASGGTAVQANKVTNALAIKINSGTTEGTNLYTFDGSAAKTLDIKAGSNVSLNAAAGVLTINATNTNYYPTTFTWTAGTTAGPTGSLTGSGMGAVSFAAIPTASGSASGVVTTGAQTFAGTKTLTAALQTGSTAVSQAGSDDSTRVATTAFVHDAITNDITALSESEIQAAVEAALSAI